MEYGFIPSEPKEGDYFFGDGMLGDVSINPSGQWDSYLPERELQNRGFETNCCVTEATLNCVEILAKNRFGDITNYADRFLASISGTWQKGGNDYGTVAETLRKNGCCAEQDWPFDVPNVQTFYAEVPEKVKRLAKAQFADNSFGHSWIANPTPDKMKQALTYSPLAMPVVAWGITDAEGVYQRPKGFVDNHSICIYGYEEGKYWKILDSYSPFEKKLAWDFGFSIGKRFTLDRVIPTTPNETGWVDWEKFVAWFRRVIGMQ